MMHSFWTLLVAATAITGLCAWWIRRPAVKGRIRFTRIEPDLHCRHRQSESRSNPKAGALTSISAAELPSLQGRDRNYILVNVASDVRSTFGGTGSTFVLSIAPGELPAVLEWLPADRAVVFQGVSDSALTLIEESVCMASSKPRCLLCDFPAHLEAL